MRAHAELDGGVSVESATRKCGAGYVPRAGRDLPGAHRANLGSVDTANVEIVKRLVEAFYARDARAALAILDRDMTFESALVEAKTYRGIGEFAQYRRDVDEAWGEWRSEGDLFLAVDETRVLHLYRIVGLGRGSGVPVAQDIAVLWTLRGGRVVHGKVYLDQREARSAAGLP
jgi:ketosteroid isomerase-like protein